MKKQLVTLFALVNFIFVTSQDKIDNIFLDRDFWQSGPSIDIVKLKIADGHDPTEKGVFGFDAVSYGIIDSAPNETLKYLLTLEGNPVDKPTHGDIIYLLWAAYKGNIEMVNHLISLGSDIQFKTARGTNILLMSGFGGQEDISLYELMFSNGVNPNYLGSNKINILLALAGSDANNEKVFRYLIEKGLDWDYRDENGNGFFHYAAKAGNLSNMRLALRENLDFKSLNAFGENAMFYASYGRKRSEVLLQTFTFLDSLGLESDVVNWKGQTPLHHAVKRANPQVIDFFIDKGVNVNQIDEEGNTAFMNSVYGKIENVQKLLPLVQNINTVNFKGRSALTNSVIYARKDIFNLLIKNGADIHVLDENNEGLISLMFQNYSERREDDFNEIFDVLLEKGVGIKPSDNNGNNLVHYAIEKNSTFLLKKALRMSLNLNHKNKLGLTPLHLAAMKATNREMIDLLINAGANKNILTDLEESTYELASENEILILNNTDISMLKLND